MLKVRFFVIFFLSLAHSFVSFATGAENVESEEPAPVKAYVTFSDTNVTVRVDKTPDGYRRFYRCEEPDAERCPLIGVVRVAIVQGASGRVENHSITSSQIKGGGATILGALAPQLVYHGFTGKFALSPKGIIVSFLSGLGFGGGVFTYSEIKRAIQNGLDGKDISKAEMSAIQDTLLAEFILNPHIEGSFNVSEDFEDIDSYLSILKFAIGAIEE